MTLNHIKLTDEQGATLEGIMHWVGSKSPIAILTGGAGTGKSTLIKSVVEGLQNLQLTYELLAPTGRAARIVGQKAEKIAKTIHSEIYALGDIVTDDDFDTKQSPFESPGFVIPFLLKTADPGQTVIIVDEASMLSDEITQSEILKFGSGRLLYDLLQYSGILNRNKVNSKILFVGDHAQLPPVKCRQSPALMKSYFSNKYGIDSEVFHLEKVLRQGDGSLVLENAERIRRSIYNNDFRSFRIKTDEATVLGISREQAIDNAAKNQLSDDSIIITASNEKALFYNRAIRERRFGSVGLPVQRGDVLLVCRNSLKHNYFNGDLVEVIDVDSERECRSERLRGSGAELDLFFRNILVRQIGVNGESSVRQCKILENLLDSSKTMLDSNQNQASMTDFKKRHPQIRSNTEEFRLALVNDEYFNALTVKYGYAITCHKAQGGEWDKVAINFEWSGKNIEYFRWAYTAITRSKRILEVINAPSFVD